MEFHRRQGSNNGNCKLTVEQVYEIRKLLKKGLRPKDIAPQFNTCRTNVQSIKNGKSWQYLPDKE